MRERTASCGACVPLSAATLFVPEISRHFFKWLAFLCHKNRLLARIIFGGERRPAYDMWDDGSDDSASVLFKWILIFFPGTQLVLSCAVWMPCCCSWTIGSVQKHLTQEFSVMEDVNCDSLSWVNRVLSATFRIHKFHFILPLPSLNLYGPRLLLFSVPLSVVKGIQSPEIDEDHHLNKMMDLGHSPSS